MREEDSTVSLQQMIRVVGGLFGVMVILIGLFCSIRIFGLVMETLQSPAGFGQQYEEWVEAVGGAEWDLTLGETTLHGARFVALGLIGAGAILLTTISLSLIRAGANVISITVGDKEAVKQILAHALGKEKVLEKPQTSRSDSSTRGATYPVT